MLQKKNVHTRAVADVVSIGMKWEKIGCNATQQMNKIIRKKM